jgi:hypothetical protein
VLTFAIVATVCRLDKLEALSLPKGNRRSSFIGTEVENLRHSGMPKGNRRPSFFGTEVENLRYDYFAVDINPMSSSLGVLVVSIHVKTPKARSVSGLGPQEK